MILPIITLPDPRLRKISAPVDPLSPDIPQLIENMIETMYAAPGVGLAAIQVAVPLRIIIAETSENKDEHKPWVFINPAITWLSQDMRVYEEGCLSIPDYFAEVERPASLKLTYQNQQGQTQELLAERHLATILQHEIDHINGTLFIDHLSKLKRDRVIKHFTKHARPKENKA